MKRRVTGSSSKISVKMPGTIAFSLAGSFIASSIDQLTSFMLQEGNVYPFLILRKILYVIDLRAGIRYGKGIL